MNLEIIKKGYGYVLVVVVMALALMLVGCSSNSDSLTSDSSNETTSSKSADDEWTQVDTSWAYKTKGENTLFKRSDGYEFTVKTQCGPAFTPTPDKEQKKTSFGTKEEQAMSFNIYNDQDSLSDRYDYVMNNKSYACIEGTSGVKGYFDSRSNEVVIWVERDNIWIEVTYGKEIIEDETTVETVLDYFEFN